MIVIRSVWKGTIYTSSSHCDERSDEAIPCFL